ncbi:hypothetical protein NK6_7750 [Bradyrhizobium diazoefficiens]|uniref:Uncharacterized protein n=1 Tax=Bradyrhizobium diazoefficiens TaxID=1355477 RepID=A0A0E4BVF7_9BRAD|nr:hypothetical protein NK6_7750 [Bradyrhizobium diazoefficiens]
MEAFAGRPAKIADGVRRSAHSFCNHRHRLASSRIIHLEQSCTKTL